MAAHNPLDRNGGKALRMQVILAPGATRSKMRLHHHTDGVQKAERQSHLVPSPCRLNRHCCPLPTDLQGPLNFLSDTALCDRRKLCRCGGNGRRKLRGRVPRGGRRWYSSPREGRQRSSDSRSWPNAPLRHCGIPS
eukprot:scaffold46743_cov63-Phaeocystis_antarctica.AAC.2